MGVESAKRLDYEILLKKAEGRLSRHLLAENLDETVRDAVLTQGAVYKVRIMVYERGLFVC